MIGRFTIFAVAAAASTIASRSAPALEGGPAAPADQPVPAVRVYVSKPNLRPLSLSPATSGTDRSNAGILRTNRSVAGVAGLAKRSPQSRLQISRRPAQCVSGMAATTTSLRFAVERLPSLVAVLRLPAWLFVAGSPISAVGMATLRHL